MNKDINKTGRIMYVIEETAAYLISIVLGGAFLAKLTLSAGFSDSLTALLTSCVNLACIFQLLSIAIFRRGGVKRKVTILYTAGELLFVLLYLTPFVKITPGVRTIVFIFLLLGGNIINNIVSSPKAIWFMSMVPDKTRGRFTAQKEATSLVCGVMFQFAMGMIIDYYEAANKTRETFIACAVAILVLTIIHTLSLVITKEKNNTPASESSFISESCEVLKDKKASSVIFISVLWAICANFTNPFLGTYQVKELGFSMTFVATLATVSAISRITASVFLGKYADKHSFSKMLRVCYVFISISYLATTLTIPSNGKFVYLIHTIFMASAMGGINSAELNLIFDYVSFDKRRTALAIKQTFYGLCGFVSTLAATPILNFIQNRNIFLFGTQIYAQQILSIVSFGLSIALIYKITKIHKRFDKEENTPDAL